MSAVEYAPPGHPHRVNVRAFCAQHRYVGPHCREPNGHHYCETVADCCTCTCHDLDPATIGWLFDEMVTTIAEMEPLLGPLHPRLKAWWAAATVLAVWQCGTDHVRIQHALGKQPTLIAEAAGRLRAAGIWDGDTWNARYAESDATDADLLELVLHVMVAEGKAEAERQDTLFVYRARQ